MKWIDIEDELPPRDVWVHITRDVEDPECTGCIKFDLIPKEMREHMEWVGYTHWCLK